MSRFILNRPDISFRYYVGGKRILQSFGGGEEEAVVGVYGASILKDCYKIDASKHGIRLRGYIGNQNFSKPNKTYQSVFLNGRYIINSTISAAVSNAYASYLMKRQYPFYVLYIDMPTEIVDVNVHPNKADVRFADNQTVYGCIYSVIPRCWTVSPRRGISCFRSKRPVASEIDAEPEKVVSPKAAPVSAVPFSAPKKEKPRNAPLNNSAKGVVSFSYEDARRELEKVRPSKTTSMELPFEPEPKAEENAVPVQSVPAEKKSLRETYADLQVEKNILEVNSPEAAPAVKTEGNSKDFFAENKRFLEGAGNEGEAEQDRRFFLRLCGKTVQYLSAVRTRRRGIYHRPARRARTADFRSPERTNAHPKGVAAADAVAVCTQSERF